MLLVCGKFENLKCCFDDIERKFITGRREEESVFIIRRTL